MTLKKYSFNILLLLFPIFLFVGIIAWGNYLYKRGYLRERFTNTDTSHSVDLPINTTTSCKNICGPQARCSITGEQCTSDIDCYGCQPLKTTNTQEPTVTKDVGGQNYAGKLTGGMAPTYSSLTTDIGSKAAFYDESKKTNIEPVQYFKGVDQWKKAFDVGMELHDKRNNTEIKKSPYLLHYPSRPTMTGEFIDDGPLASNDYL